MARQSMDHRHKDRIRRCNAFPGNGPGCAWAASPEKKTQVNSVLRFQTLFSAVLFCLTVSTAAADDGLYSAAQAARGEETYQQHCALCHGARLQGTPAAPLTGEAFRGRWEDGKHTLDDLYYIIRSLMPNNAPGSLSKVQYADVVAYILKVNNYPAGEAELVPNAAAMKAAILQPH
jgi:mono/diheme cytochrome c family protein